MKTIPISQGRTAMIDDEDFDRVTQNKWSLQKSPNDKTEYAVRSIKINGKWKHISLHRFIMNPIHELKIDHIDGNGLNCQKYNMRQCTHAENLRNKRMCNKHGFKGVAFVGNLLPHRQWVAQIKLPGGHKLQKHFPTLAEAAAAYNALAIQHFGEFAKLNPI